jgi:hypothetical protein
MQPHGLNSETILGDWQKSFLHFPVNVFAELPYFSLALRA